jgi:hypothetical protein
MNYRAARLSLSIRVVTAGTLAMAGGFVIAGFHDRNLLVVGAAVAIVALLCYLLAPVSYDLSGGCLTVVLRVGKVRFGRIVRCARITERLPFTVRLFGNGGLFAGTGIYWNKRFGVFRAYITSAKQLDMALVETEKYKVLVTPEDVQRFIEAAMPSCSDSDVGRRTAT